MSFPNNSIEYCPVRTNIDWSQVQFSDYPNQEVQVADYSKVEYFQPSDSDDDEQSDEAGQHANGQSRFFPFSLLLSSLLFFSSSRMLTSAQMDTLLMVVM